MRVSPGLVRAVLFTIAIAQGILYAAGLPRVGNQALSLNDLARRVLPATVSITGEDADGRPISPGSGFFVGGDKIISDYRVVKNAIKIHAVSTGGNHFELAISGVDERLAAVLLTIVRAPADGDAGGKKVVKLTVGKYLSALPRDAEAPKTGDEAFVVSTFGGAGSALVPTRIDEVRDVAGIRYYHLAAALSSDSLGGPVLNAEGYAIGMLVSSPGDSTGASLSMGIGNLGLCGLPNVEPHVVFKDHTFPGGSEAVPGGVATGRRESGEPAGAPTADNPGIEIIRKSGGVLQGSAIRRAHPSYPPLAMAARVSGAVVVEVVVDQSGDVISARAVSGHPLLKDCAIGAARGWKFTPTALAGSPVKVIGTITFNFEVEPDPSSRRAGVGASAGPNSDNTPAARVDTRPMPLYTARPGYTELARANKVQGIVTARVLVGVDGLVKEVRIVRGLPDGLDEEAIKALEKTKFKPATRNGEAVPYWVSLEVEFNLR